jgi:hypothetical protein
MFLRAFVEIHVPQEGAASVLRRLPQVLVENFATQAMDHGHTVLADVGFEVGSSRVGRQVEIVLGEAVETPSRIWLPINWKPASGTGVFPALEGELEAAPLGKELTQIGLSARYKPPFGVVGSTLDRMFLHRVAEATVQDFVQRVANAVENGWRLKHYAGASR